ncbi:sensor histidine kinase [Idiomarina sp.]|uniref:sensor histidine kinase n=1 Tax=Idiomarina sp. TaxID=1874361 RepID=UPI003A913EFD
MATSWLSIVARSYWHSLTLACFVWGGLGLFALTLGLVSIGFRMPLQDSLLALFVGSVGYGLSRWSSVRQMLSRHAAYVWLAAFVFIAIGAWELLFAFQHNLYIFRGVLFVLLGIGVYFLSFYTDKARLFSEGSNWLWIMLLLYFSAGIWWLYALNQPLNEKNDLQNSVPAVILVGHFALLTMLSVCFELVLQFYQIERERNEALEKLNCSQRYFQSLFDHNPSAAFSLDLSGRFTDLNAAGEDYLQVKKADAIGMHYEYILAPSEVTKVSSIFQQALQGEPVHYETNIVRKSGEKIALSVSNIPMLEGERVVGVFGIAQDITHIKQTYTELKQVNSELRNFAAVASHDLQEPLRKIVRFGELLQETELQGQEKDYLERMISASRRMQQLIQEILELARLGKDSVEVHTVSLFSIVQTVLNEHEANLTSAGAELEVNLKHEIVADPKLIKRMFENLVTNSIKYRRKDKQLKIYIHSRRELDDSITVCFSDNGIGIDPAHHQSVFKPFKRLHSRSDIPGTGMGLAIVKKIIDLHRGDVVLSSQFGDGTTAKLTLPSRNNQEIL